MRVPPCAPAVAHGEAHQRGADPQPPPLGQHRQPVALPEPRLVERVEPHGSQHPGSGPRDHLDGAVVPAVAVVPGEDALLAHEHLVAHAVVGGDVLVAEGDPDVERHHGAPASAAAGTPSRPPPKARSNVLSAEQAWQRTQPARASWLIIPASASSGATRS